MGDVGLVGLLYHVPAASHAEFPAVEILGDILDSEPSGRLYKALVESKKASSVSVSPSACHDPGLDRDHGRGQHQGPGGPGKGPRRHALGRRGGGPVGGHPGGSRSRPPERSSRTASWPRPIPTASPSSCREWAAQGDWRLYFLNRDRIEQVTPAQVKEVAEKYFTTSNRTVGFFVPTAKPERTPIPAVPDIAKLVEGYTGRQLKGVSSETSDVAPLAIEARRAAARADRGRQAGLLAQEDPRRVGPACG